jgi:hypothetical protein
MDDLGELKMCILNTGAGERSWLESQPECTKLLTICTYLSRASTGWNATATWRTHPGDSDK